MKMAGNTILITGGTSGLGFELAAQPLERKTPSLSLDETNPGLPQLARSCRTFIHLRSDVSDPQAIRLLFAEVTQRFPALNVLINNTGIMRKINLHDAADSLEDLTREIETNLVGPMQMIKQFLPYLKACKSPAAIMNVSSGLAFIPLPLSPIYCAAKAGLHSYTQSLRVQLKNTNVKVFELAAPGAKTSLNDIFAANEVDSRILMEPKKLVTAAIRGMEKDNFEIKPGLSKVLKLLSRIAPQLALHASSKPVEATVAQKASISVQASVR